MKTLHLQRLKSATEMMNEKRRIRDIMKTPHLPEHIKQAFLAIAVSKNRL